MAEAGILTVARDVGAGYAGTAHADRFARTEGMLGGGQLAGCPAARLGLDAHGQQIAHGISQPQQLPDVEDGLAVAAVRFIGVVFHAHLEHGQCELCHCFSLLADEATFRHGCRLAPLYVQMDGMVDACQLYEPLLFGYARLEFVGYP